MAESEWKTVKSKARTKKGKTSLGKGTPPPSLAVSEGALDFYSICHERPKKFRAVGDILKVEINSEKARGDPRCAKRLINMFRVSTELAEKGVRAAGRRIFIRNNAKSDNHIIIDLHGQHVDAVCKIVDNQLRSLSLMDPSKATLTLITGCGSHSKNGRAKIRETVEKILEEKNIPWKRENDGRIVITSTDVFKSSQVADEETPEDDGELMEELMGKLMEDLADDYWRELHYRIAETLGWDINQGTVRGSPEDCTILPPVK